MDRYLITFQCRKGGQRATARRLQGRVAMRGKKKRKNKKNSGLEENRQVASQTRKVEANEQWWLRPVVVKEHENQSQEKQGSRYLMNNERDSFPHKTKLGCMGKVDRARTYTGRTA